MEKKIMDDCIRRGVTLPDSIQNAPRLFEGLGLYYTAFMELTSCREMGNIVGPLNWLTIQRYCEVHEIEGEQCEDMHFFLSHMDSAFLSHLMGKVEAKQKQIQAQAARASAKKPSRRR